MTKEKLMEWGLTEEQANKVIPSQMAGRNPQIITFLFLNG